MTTEPVTRFAIAQGPLFGAGLPAVPPAKAAGALLAALALAFALMLAPAPALAGDPAPAGVSTVDNPKAPAGQSVRPDIVCKVLCDAGTVVTPRDHRIFGPKDTPVFAG